MSICPWCGKNSFSFWQIQTLGPVISRRCPHCDHAVRASWPSSLMSLALLLVPVAAGFILGHAASSSSADTLLSTGGFLVGAALCLAWGHKYARLVRASDDAPHGTAKT